MEIKQPAGEGMDESLELLEQDKDLAWAYRPIDRDDMPWMLQLGCEWPEDEDEEATWLQHMNGLYIVGSEKLGNQFQQDASFASGIYKAREEFLSEIPLLAACFTTYSKYFKEGNAKPRSPLALTEIAGTARVLHSYGLPINKLYSNTSNSMLIATTPRQVRESIEYLQSVGINKDTVVKSGFLLSLSSATIHRRLRILYNLARLRNPIGYREDVHRLVESGKSHLLGQRDERLWVVGRISVALNNPSAPLDEYAGMSRAELSTLVAAHLQYGGNTHNPYSLSYHSRRLQEEYSRDELRGFIAQNAGSKIVDTYLRGYPIEDDEAARLPKLDRLPNKQADWSAVASPGESSRRVIAYARERREDPQSNDEWNGMLDAISAGLSIEESVGDPAQRSDQQEQLVTEGRKVRKQVAEMFLSRAIELRFPPGSGWTDEKIAFYSGRLQMSFVNLMIAIVNASRRRPEDRIEDPWENLKEEIRLCKTTMRDLYDEDVSDISGGYDGAYTSESAPQNERDAPLFAQPASTDVDIDERLRRLAEKFNRH